MASYVGIDAGGSGSRWAVLGAGGESSWRTGDDGPPIQVAEFGVEVSVDRLAVLLGDLVADSAFEVAVVGLAGGDDPGLRTAIESGLIETGVLGGRRLRVVGDTITGAAAALHDGPGVALFGGTGSFAMARSPAGGLVRIGGRGNRVSDHGSGYRVALAAAEAVLLADEGMAPATGLEHPICTALQVEAPQQLGLAFLSSSAADVAGCFPLVVAQAVGGDSVAREILASAAGEFAKMAVAAMARAELPRDARVVLGGGTQQAPLYRELSVAALRDCGCVGDIDDLSVGPAQGAALLARSVALGTVPMVAWIDG